MFNSSSKKSARMMYASAVILGLAISSALPALASTLIFSDFSSGSDQAQFTRNGSYSDVAGDTGTWTAQFVNGNIRLTGDGAGQSNPGYGEVGSAFLTTPYLLGPQSDIDTTFGFKITNTNSTPAVPGDGADGFAFVIQGEGADAYGNSGAGLGYGGLGSVSASNRQFIRPAFAVEFRTFSQDQIAITRINPDTNPAHPGYGLIDVLASKVLDQTLNQDPLDGQHTATIHYKGSTHLLQVYLDGVFQLQTVLPTGIQDTIFPQAYFGFTGSTGAHKEIAEITSWTLTVPEPSSLMLFSIGFAGLGMAKRKSA